jgi:hypothetical protein
MFGEYCPSQSYLSYIGSLFLSSAMFFSIYYFPTFNVLGGVVALKIRNHLLCQQGLLTETCH